MDKQPEETTTQQEENLEQCTENSCIKDQDQDKLSCIVCNRSVHYRCTKLPLYQLQLFVKRRIRSFTCVNCVEITKDLARKMKGYDPDLSTEIEDLTLALQEVSFQKDEVASQNRTLKMKHLLMKEYVKSGVEAKEKYEEAIKSLQDEVQLRMEQTKQHADRESKLEKQIDALRKNLKQMEKKTDGGLLETLEQKFKDFENLLKKELEDSTKILEERFGTAPRKTYADALGVNTPFDEDWDDVPISNTRQNMRQIICSVRNEEKEEEREREVRAKNIIVYGVNESEGGIDEDRAFIADLAEAIGIDVTIKDIFRLGKKVEGKARPLKVTVNSKAERQKVLDSMYNIKGNDKFKNIRVTKDHTLAERNEIRDLVKQAKERNENAPENSLYEWKVREDPKNGMRVMRFKKRSPITRH